MPSQIDETWPVFGEPTTASVRTNFGTAKSEISTLQERLTDPPPDALTTSLVLAYTDESGILQPLGRVMVDQPDPAIGGGRWLYVRLTE
jgi:hypothetical protein